MTDRDEAVPNAARDLRARVARTSPEMHVDVVAVLRVGRRRRAARRAAGSVSAAVVAVAVVAGALQLGATSGERVRLPASHPVNETATPEAPTEYKCGDLVVPPEVLADGRPATQLPEVSLAALESMDLYAGPDWASWTVLEASDSRIALLRPNGDGDGTTHSGYELYTIGLVAPGEGAAPVNEGPEPAWSVLSWTDCALQAELDGLNNVTIALDPSRPVDPEATQVHLLVTEDECTGGADPTERIRVVDVRYSATAVELVIGVERWRPDDASAGAPGPFLATCVGVDPAPFVVPLEEPLAGRAVLDGTLLQPAPLTTGRSG